MLGLNLGLSNYQTHRDRWHSMPGLLRVAGFAAVGLGAYAMGAKGILGALQKKAIPYLEEHFNEKGLNLASSWIMEEVQNVGRTAERQARSIAEGQVFKEKFLHRFAEGTEVLNALPEIRSLKHEDALASFLKQDKVLQRLRHVSSYSNVKVLDAFSYARTFAGGSEVLSKAVNFEKQLAAQYAQEFEQYATHGGPNLSLKGSRGLLGKLHSMGGMDTISTYDLIQLAKNKENFFTKNIAGLLKQSKQQDAFIRQLGETEAFFTRHYGAAGAEDLMKRLPSGYLQNRSTEELVNLRSVQRFTHHAITTPIKSIKVPLVPFFLEMPPFRLFPFLASEGFSAAHIKAGEWSPEISRLLKRPAHQALQEDVLVYGKRAYQVSGDKIEALANEKGVPYNFSLRYSKSGFFKDMMKVRSAEGADQPILSTLQQGLSDMLDSKDPRKLLQIHKQSSDPSKWNKVDNWFKQFRGLPEEIEDLSKLHPRQLVKLLARSDISKELQVQARRSLFEQASSDPLDSLSLFKSIKGSMGEDPFLKQLVKKEHRTQYEEAFSALFDKPGTESVHKFLQTIGSLEDAKLTTKVKFESVSSSWEETVHKLLAQTAPLYSPAEGGASSYTKEFYNRVLGDNGLTKGSQEFYQGLLSEWSGRQIKSEVLRKGIEGAVGEQLNEFEKLLPSMEANQKQRLRNFAKQFITWNEALKEKPDILETILSKIEDPKHRAEIAIRAFAPEVSKLSAMSEMIGFEDPFFSKGPIGSNLRKKVEEQYVAPHLADRFNWKGKWSPLGEADLVTHSDYYPILESKNLLESIKTFDVNNPLGSIKEYFSQYRSAFDPTAPMSEVATPAYFFVDRLNRYIADFGLGLPEKLRSTPLGGVVGFLGLRVAPAMAGIEAWKYLNYESHKLLGTSPDEVRADAQAHTQLGIAKVFDTLRITPLLKKIVDLSAGTERYVNPRSAEELDEFLKRGYNPIRKGRFWTIGTRSEFTGAGVEWYAPSWYQMAKSRWQEASNVDLDSEAYWRHSWIPTLENPLAPLWRIADRDWWANKHRKDRPYPFAGTSFDTESAWGPFLNPIANRLTGAGEPLTSITADSLQNTQYLGHLPNQPTIEAEGGQGRNFSVLRTTGGGMMRLLGLPSGKGLLGGLLGGLGGGSGGGGGAGGGVGGGGGYGSGTNISREMSGGGLGNPGTVPSYVVSQFAREPNENLADTSFSYPKDYTGRANIRVPGAENPLQDVQEIGRSARGAMGVYGFFLEQGFPLDRHDPFTVQNPTSATGWSRRYWMKEYGGIGGGLTEWSRRFFHAPENDPDAWNPLKNDQPEWMPENLRHGDPYCVSPETLIETKEGLKPASEVKEGDFVLSHKGNWQPIVARRERPLGEEEAYEFKVNSLSAFPFTVSQEHPLRVWNPETKKEEWRTSKEVQPGDLLVYPIEKSKKNQEVLDIHDILPNCAFTDNYVYPCGQRQDTAEAYEFLEEHGDINFWFKTRIPFLSEQGWRERSWNMAKRQFAKGHSFKRVSRYLALSEDIGLLLGWYIAEGCVDKSGSQTTFSLHLREEQVALTLVAIASSIAPDLSFTFERIKETNGASLRIYSKTIASLLVHLSGKYARYKKLCGIPFSKDFLRGMLKGYFEGDGCSFSGKREVVQACSCNLNLLYSIRKILLQFGIISAVSDKPARPNTIVRSWHNYSIKLSGDDALLFRELILKEESKESISKGKLSFIQDNLLIMKVRSKVLVEDCPIVIGFEVEGDDSFCVAGVATHNTRVRGIGELRLPGEAYERAHQVKMMEMRASAMGKSEEELVSDFFHEGAYASHESKAMKEGTRMHKVIQRRLHKAGIAIGTEVPVWDEKNQISGHIDAILRTAKGPEIIDIKTMTPEKFHSGKVFQENVDQLTTYAGLTGIHNIGLIYVNREDPSETRHEQLSYNPHLYKSLISKVDHARKIAWGMVNSGKKRRGDLYDLVTRFEILADTAAGSPEFEAVSMAIAGQTDQLTEGEKARVTAARERSGKLRKLFDLHDYRFSNQDQLVSTHALVQRVINMNTLLVKGMGAVRLAGISLNSESLDKLGIEPGKGESDAEAFYRHYGIGAGSVISLKYSPAEKDAYTRSVKENARGKSLTDMLFGRRDSNASFLGTPAPKVIVGSLNRRLLKKGIGTERAEDRSPAAIDVRYSTAERMYGRAFEKFAHLDTIFHTKFLRVRSPLEQHIRGEVYGSDESSWSDMLGSYIKPTMESMASRNPIFAAMTGAFIGSMFQDSRQGKTAFALGGAAVGAALSLGRMAFKGENWIPKRVKDRWELDEYYDKLKYVKWKGIATEAAKKAKDVEHVDPEALMARHFAIAEWKKDQKRKMSQVLRDLAETKGLKPEDLTGAEVAQVKKARKTINKMDEPSYEVLGPWATMSMQAMREYQRTLTGLPEKTNLSQVLSAVPKKHREIAAALIEHGSAKEKTKFFHLLPEMEQHSLGPYLGIDRREIPEKPKLDEYFKDHFLPDENWQGWRPEINLGDIKTRAEDYAGVHLQHPSEAKIKKAEIMSYGAGVPISQHPTLGDLHGKLTELLSGNGMTNLRIHMSSTPAKRAALTINMNLDYDDHDKVVDEITNRL